MGVRRHGRRERSDRDHQFSEVVGEDRVDRPECIPNAVATVEELEAIEGAIDDRKDKGRQVVEAAHGILERLQVHRRRRRDRHNGLLDVLRDHSGRHVRVFLLEVREALRVQRKGRRELQKDVPHAKVQSQPGVALLGGSGLDQVQEGTRHQVVDQREKPQRRFVQRTNRFEGPTPVARGNRDRKDHLQPALKGRQDGPEGLAEDSDHDIRCLGRTEDGRGLAAFFRDEVQNGLVPGREPGQKGVSRELCRRDLFRRRHRRVCCCSRALGVVAGLARCCCASVSSTAADVSVQSPVRRCVREPSLVDRTRPLLDVVLPEGVRLPELRIQNHALLEGCQPGVHVLQGVAELRLQQRLDLFPYLRDRLPPFLLVGHPPQGFLSGLEPRQRVDGLREVLFRQKRRDAADGRVPGGGRFQDLPRPGEVRPERVQRRQCFQGGRELLAFAAAPGRFQQRRRVRLHPVQADADPSDVGGAPGEYGLELCTDPSDVLVAGLGLDLQLQGQLGHLALEAVRVGVTAGRHRRSGASRSRWQRRRR
mmetsp:Transcript_29382/g.61175  ORF Transcript_29382/g.61175 Transcript_29382/m.61175 type:complete len:536 (-) Transcript_29382:1457-3064(-)